MQIPSGLRERKKERTRKAIIAAAWELFHERGYDQTTIEEIAERADISRRTFFRYFPAKEAVVFHNSADRLARFRSLLFEELEAGETPPFEAVSRACLEIARHYLANKPEVINQYRLIESSPALVMREGEIDREWMASIAEALMTGSSAADDRQSRILAGAIFGVMRATLGEWLSSKGTLDLVRLGEQAMSMFSQEAS